MHSILHDWPDEQCVEILTQLSKSMEPGYSKFLINENVIPPRHAYWEATALDIIMMTGFSSRERTKHEWEDLLGASGLRICNIVRYHTLIPSKYNPNPEYHSRLSITESKVSSSAS